MWRRDPRPAAPLAPKTPRWVWRSINNLWLSAHGWGKTLQCGGNFELIIWNCKVRRSLMRRLGGAASFASISKNTKVTSVVSLAATLNSDIQHLDMKRLSTCPPWLLIWHYHPRTSAIHCLCCEAHLEESKHPEIKAMQEDLLRQAG